MRTLKKVLAVACITLASAGCPGPATPEGPDASVSKPDAATCKPANKCGSKCCKDTETCVDGACVTETNDCGNGTLDGTEACDGTNLNSKTCATEGFASGTLSCNADCTLNTTACVVAADCGNNTINGTEACDGTNLNGKTCATEGYASGTLTCKTNCTLDTSACVAAADCGNGALDGTEQCDGTNLNNKTCVTEGFASGTLACRANCTLNTSGCVAGADCGNGAINGTEACDGTNLNNKTCVTEGFASGTLACNANCSLNTAGCVVSAECGNGTINGTEQCDGTNLNSKTCVTQGFASGTLSCNGNCTFNTSSCVPASNPCGNGAIDGTEQCDGTNLNEKTCVTQGFASGTLACKTDCTFNTSGCVAATCNSDEVACGSGCCTKAIEFCKTPATATCGTLATCDAATQTVCFETCCTTATQTCDTATKACKDKPVVTCSVDNSIASVTVNEAADKDDYGIYVMGPIPTTDGTEDFLSLELYDGAGVFANGLASGSYPLTGEELNYKTCGLCVLIYGDVDFNAQPATVKAKYMATGGGVEITTLDVNGAGVVAKLTNVTFDHVNIASDYTSTKHPDGCQATIVSADVTGTLPIVCDPLDYAAVCQAGEGCYFDGSANSCATPTVQGEAGDDCNAGTECKPGLDCFGSSAPGTCYAYCSVAAPTACTGTDQCSALDGDLGYCAACPADKLCGNVCCGKTQTCNASTVCEDIPTCDVFNQASCTVAGEACYFDRTSELATCQTAGTKAEGDACTADNECPAGMGCVGGYYNKCAKWCNPANGDADCTGTFDTCDEFTPTVGGCY